MSYLPNFIAIILLLILPLGSSQKPDCPTRCGNVSFPYPFGVGSDCSLEESFNITCFDSIPYIFIKGATIEVVEITSTEIRFKWPLSLFTACFDIRSGNMTWHSNWNSLNFRETQYTLSEDNWLTGIGCDDILVSELTVANETLLDSCLGFCLNGNPTGSGRCPDNGDKNSAEGCCRSPIPKGTSQVVVGLLDLSKTSNKSDRTFPCSYVFLKEKGSWVDNNPQYSYNYSILLDNTTSPFEDEPPVVRLDWRIGNQSCDEARRNSSNYACQANSDCVDFDAKIEGYLCNCSEGYEGNPYLYPGCTDIDECRPGNPKQCGPHSVCINTPGNFTCPCEKGYTGDGRLGSSGCTGYNYIIKFVIIGLSSALGLLLLLLRLRRRR